MGVHVWGRGCRCGRVCGGSVCVRVRGRANAACVAAGSSPFVAAHLLFSAVKNTRVLWPGRTLTNSWGGIGWGAEAAAAHELGQRAEAL